MSVRTRTKAACNGTYQFFENGAAFQTKNRSSRQPEKERIARLEKKIQPKDEVQHFGNRSGECMLQA